jgi:hypothetical protein
MSDQKMDDNLEQQLRAALRPVNPPEDFPAGVLARIAREGSVRRLRPRLLPRSPAATGWLGFGLAASVVVAVLIGHQWQARRTEQGLEARRQLLEALRVTDEKLDVAYRAVNTTPRGADPQHSGA